MEVQITERWEYRTVEITFYENRNGELYVAKFLKDSVIHMEPVPYGAVPPPSIVLRQDAFHALAESVSRFVPAGEATSEHLRDAVEMRDRLLAMVEARWNA